MNEFNVAAYESPIVEVFNLEVEGAILQDSLQGVGNDPFGDGGGIDF